MPSEEDKNGVITEEKPDNVKVSENETCETDKHEGKSKARAKAKKSTKWNWGTFCRVFIWLLFLASALYCITSSFISARDHLFPPSGIIKVQRNKNNPKAEVEEAPPPIETTPKVSTKEPQPAATTGGEYFTSIVRMKELAILEHLIVEAMANVLKEQTKDHGKTRKTGWKWRKAMSYIKAYLQDYDNSIRPMLLKSRRFVSIEPFFRWPIILGKYEDRKALLETVVSHPLIAFRTIRRVLLNLPLVLENNVNGILDDVVEISNLIWPPLRKEDLDGAAEGIVRLQIGFKITPYNFSKGRLQNLETKSGLTAFDCYYIGNMEKEEATSHYAVVIEWMLQSLRMLLRNKENSMGMISIQTVRKGLANAVEKHNELYDDGHHHEYTFSGKVSENLASLTRENEMQFVNGMPSLRPTPPYVLGLEDYSDQDVQNFDALCRGEQLRTAGMTKNLKCFYKTDNPYLIVKPLKTEVHSEDPLIVQFYEILPDSINKRFRTLTTENLVRAMVLSDKKDASTEPSKIRISCNAWIDEKTDVILNGSVKNLIEATGLNLFPDGAAEIAQISSYGAIGGFYAAHYDNLYESRYTQFRTLTNTQISQEDRIATAMFYLSNVELGGGTAFPKVGVLSKAIKGSAMFWYNMKEDGNRHDLTLHGGCPVLLGEKWVINKWIRGGEQMFIRKCPLDMNSITREFKFRV